MRTPCENRPLLTLHILPPHTYTHTRAAVIAGAQSAGRTHTFTHTHKHASTVIVNTHRTHTPQSTHYTSITRFEQMCARAFGEIAACIVRSVRSAVAVETARRPAGVFVRACVCACRLAETPPRRDSFPPKKPMRECRAPENSQLGERCNVYAEQQCMTKWTGDDETVCAAFKVRAAIAIIRPRAAVADLQAR